MPATTRRSKTVFHVNQVTFDYLTLTSFNPIFAQAVADWLQDNMRHGDPDKHRMQYGGTLWHSERGNVFIGEGKQNGHNHYLIQASGFVADDIWNPAKQFVSAGITTVTRLDLQRTVEYERHSWSQSLLAAGLRSIHGDRRSVSYVESRSGPQGSKLATVYFGSRQSDRFVRIYEKKGLNEEVFLRFEVEFKSPRSHAVALAILHKGDYEDIYLEEVARVGHPVIAVVFGKEGWTKAVRVVKPEPATLKWLREQVAPALLRVVNDHNIDSEEVERLFLRIILDKGSGAD